MLIKHGDAQILEVIKDSEKTPEDKLVKEQLEKVITQTKKSDKSATKMELEQDSEIQ